MPEVRKNLFSEKYTPLIRGQCVLEYLATPALMSTYEWKWIISELNMFDDEAFFKCSLIDIHHNFK